MLVGATAARPDHLLEIYLAEPYATKDATGSVAEAPTMTMLGPQVDRRVSIVLGGDILTFTVAFQPAGLHVLFGLSAEALVDREASALHVSRLAAQLLHDRLRRATSFEERVAAAESWVAARLADSAPPDAVAHAATILARAGGRVPIRELAGRAGLSPRQFTRRFRSQVGVAPKLYARILRLDWVMKQRLATPQASWTELAHAAGYADQAHLIRDTRALCDAAPQRFFGSWACVQA
ncbi:MAG: AraC family transcriptional regulator [Erythrobacter sp.]|uniref:helix-turn-helix domain-containing protein n=1 Tax=Erythrobacter sp. TaxID=1042 RepID=UPI0025FAADDA|nr:AraC family transcriptional regulator [Erythrobacter sp.]MCL9998601.1 AraC family transcriptional regulator [Erythrobacter sp.]